MTNARRRARYLLVMGLPVTACENEPAAQHPIASDTSSASAAPAPQALPSASASTSATASAAAVVEATPPPAMVRGLSNVPSFTAQYPHKNHYGCTTAEAHCYLLSDLRKMADAGAACPASEDVPQGCMGGARCDDPGARTTGELLAAVSHTQSAEKGATACCYTLPDYCCPMCGRSLRDGERVVVTPLADDVRLSPAAARAAAMGAAEHASIASFARTSLELLALGAPAAILEATHRAAIDEIEHARKCYALASKLAGKDVRPGALPMHPLGTPSFASVAASTFRDACVGEAIGAAQLHEMIGCETEREVTTMLTSILEDEERHVDLAFETLAWLVRQGGPDAADAVLLAAESLPPHEATQPVVRDVVLPCTRALASLGGRGGVRTAKAGVGGVCGHERVEHDVAPERIQRGG